MALRFQPRQGALVMVDFDQGFRPPEMVKLRMAVVLSPRIDARPGLATVVALSSLAPARPMPYHLHLSIPLQLPEGWSREMWIKGDMVNTVGLHRTEAIRLPGRGRASYQLSPLPRALFRKVQGAVLHGLGLGHLSRHLGQG